VIQQEIQALENNETLDISDLPPDKKALGCKWVFKIKYNSDGTVERYKAPLVIFGNHQVEGIDFMETFALVAKMVIMRVFLAVAAAKHYELRQMDIYNAFLLGDPQEEVYVKIPLGFQVSSSTKVCRAPKISAWAKTGNAMLVCQIDHYTKGTWFPSVLFGLFVVFYATMTSASMF